MDDKNIEFLPTIVNQEIESFSAIIESWLHNILTIFYWLQMLYNKYRAWHLPQLYLLCNVRAQFAQALTLGDYIGPIIIIKK